MNFILRGTIAAVKALYNVEISEESINLQETRKEFEGDVTVVVFPLTKVSKKNPEQTGQELGAYLQESLMEIKSYNVVKGFLNLALTDAYLITLFKSTIQRSDFGSFDAKNEKVVVEYSSPNTNKPLHLGHVRNNLLGYSVSKILEASGYDVVKCNLVNDRGIHICKSMLAWLKFGNGVTPESAGLKGDKLVGDYYVAFDKEYKKQVEELRALGKSDEEAKRDAPIIKEAQNMLQRWEAGDEEVISLWKTMNGWVYEGFDKTYRKLGVSFDKYYYESDTYLLGKDLIEEGLSKGVFYKKEDNSVWIDLREEGLDEKLVLRGDGTSVYITQDLGTAQLKHDEFKANKSIYVVGNEQDYHFKVLFLILKMLGKNWADGAFHLSYGMVDLPSGKMKSREGTVVDADDLMVEMIDTARKRTEELGKVEGFSAQEKESLFEMIGMGALKYFLLKVEPKKRLLFDPSESIDFQGHTGPFIQYTHARICSVLTRANSEQTDLTYHLEGLTNTERELILSLNKYPDAVLLAASDYSPSVIANYVYDLAKLYNKFYHEEPILKAEDRNIRSFRLALSGATASIIRKSMNLLGIHVPERM